MKGFKILIILFFFSFSLYAQSNNGPTKSTEKPKTEKKYIDLEELKAMKANGATKEEINARYNEMIEAIERDFHGLPAKKADKKAMTLGGKNHNQAKEIKPIS